MTTYCTLAEAKKTIGGLDSDTLDDAYIEAAVLTATAKIDAYCGRVFVQDTVATTQVYTPDPCLSYVDTDDISTTSGLIVKTGNDATYGTTLTSYTPYPLGGLGPNGRTGWPYRRLQLLNTFFLRPIPYGLQETVQVTAKFGWAAIPDDVRMACRLLAHQIYKAKDAPFGVAGFDAGIVSVNRVPIVAQLLDVYRLSDAYLGIA